MIDRQYQLGHAIYIAQRGKRHPEDRNFYDKDALPEDEQLDRVLEKGNALGYADGRRLVVRKVRLGHETQRGDYSFAIGVASVTNLVPPEQILPQMEHERSNVARAH